MKSGLMHPAMHRQLVEQAVNEERARCLEIVKEACAKAAKTQCERAEKTQQFYIDMAWEKHYHMHRLALELSEEITKQIRGQNG